MNTVKAETSRGGACRSKPLTGMLIAGLVLGLAACATSRQATKGMQESGFLGDYSQLEKGQKGQAALVYINPAVTWNKYTKVKINPVQLWKSDDPESELSKLSAENQQRLIDLLNTALVDALKNDYEIVNQAGPGVLVIRGAVTDARPSKPVIGLISSVYLPLKLVSLGKQALTGTGIGVGVVTVECELLDGQTQQRLVAAVDRRSGTTALRSKFDGSWGDIKLSFDWWANRLRTRLAEERAGVTDKTAM